MKKLSITLTALLITAISASAALAQGAVYVQPGRYEIQIASTGKVLDLRREDMRSVQQYSRSNAKNQQWDIESVGSNSYYIRSADNGAYLSVESARNGGRVVADSSRQGDSWRFVELGNGNMMIVHRSGMALDLTEGNTRDTAPMQVWSQAKNANQQFRLVPVANVGATYNPGTAGRFESSEAYQAGVNDRTSNLGRNYRRHRDMYDRYSEREFERNYNAGYNTGRTSDVVNDDLNGMSAVERRIYNEAYQFGQQDARSSNTANYRRYSDGYNRRQESVFQRGYEAGYNSNGRNDRYTNDRLDNDQFDLSRLSQFERRAYDDGYQIGQRDARSGYSLDYRRYNSRYTSRQEPFFQRGYEVGYNSVRRY